MDWLKGFGMDKEQIIEKILEIYDRMTSEQKRLAKEMILDKRGT